MKKVCLAVTLAFALDATMVPQTIQAGDASAFYPPAKKVRASVSGAGKTRSEAESDAERNARAISFSYRTINKKTSGSGTQWICIMTIEYEEK